MKTDLSILFENPEKDKQAILTIEPLAPLSIVSTLPGSYYKSLDKPTKFNLCGMFENILGLHIGDKDRTQIKNKIKNHYKKNYGIDDFDLKSSSVGYRPLLGHLFEIELTITPKIVARYDDLWTQHLKHNDKRHMDGTANLSWQVIKQKSSLQNRIIEIDNDPTLSKKEKKKKKDNKVNTFVKENFTKLPLYYSSPTTREFIVLDGNYQIKLSMSSHLLKGLEQSLQENNLAYLGTNEGWVDLSIKEM